MAVHVQHGLVIRRLTCIFITGLRRLKGVNAFPLVTQREVETEKNTMCICRRAPLGVFEKRLPVSFIFCGAYVCINRLLGIHTVRVKPVSLKKLRLCLLGQLWSWYFKCTRGISIT